MLKFGNKSIKQVDIIEMVRENENWQQELNKVLPELEFAKRWEIVKEVLPELEGTKARDFIRALLADNMPHIREKLETFEDRLLAVDCLGYFSSRESVESLYSLLNHKDEAVQLCAAGALKRQTPRLVVPYLIRALMDNSVLPARAGEVLNAMGYLGQEALEEAYPQAKGETKAYILELMVEAENPKCRRFLQEALLDENTKLKNKALEAILRLSFDELWPSVLECLLDDSWVIRAKALEVLAKLKIKEAEEYMELLLDDDDPFVRQCAGDYLGNEVNGR